MPENINKVEVHGCIVCARLFNILVVYDPDGRMIDCIVTSFGGHRVLDERRPLVACDIHEGEVIEKAYKRWQSRNGKENNNEQEET
jgi:hypothetical protein